MTSKRNTILDAIVTRLATITTSSGYNTTVSSVARDSRIGFELAASKFPLVDVILVDEVIEEQSADYVFCRANIDIEFSVRGINSTSLCDLSADIQNCIANDNKLNIINPTITYVSEMACKGLETDGGTYEHSTGVLHYELHYFYTYGSA